MIILAEYGVALTLRFPMIKAGSQDLAGSVDWTPATGDTKLSKDGANVANATNNPSAVGGSGSKLWSLALTATELQAGEVVVQIVDSATKAVEDQVLVIHTFGNAAARHKFNLNATIAGPGALQRTLGITVGGNPLEGASVWIATDAGGANVVAGPLITSSLGIVTLLLDAGGYYAWVQKDGYNAIAGQAITVS